jgi:1-deoxy-D-xylulose-5-phosphate synthase
MYKILDKVNNPEDLKNLSIEDMNLLAEDIRIHLVNHVSKTGGHLASNLGVVELTLAMHYVFDSPKDKMIWDVGHQSYVHKILTGRKNKFDSLRKLNGLSGFPKRSESEHDVFETGHSSTSVSAAVGFVNARDVKGEDYNVIAVIGDGALTGGMAFEALNDAGRKKTNMIVILNDNEMSISKNVGSVSTVLSKLRTGNTYYSAKKGIECFVDKIPFAGEYIVKFIRKVKDSLKQFFFNGGMLFEEFGFRYIGPVDGHDIEALIKILARIKNVKAPIVLHVHTKKGKGYLPAEKNPDIFHGIGKFDIESGVEKENEIVSFSEVFGKKLVSIAEKNSNIIAITAAMKSGTGLEKFAEKFPNRFYDVGIAEQHGLTMAAGMASNGMTPVYAIYSTFFQRAYDQFVHDVALQNLHVVICIDRAGLVGKDGETHQGVFDGGLLYQIPNTTVLTPSDFDDLERMLEWATEEGKGPVVIRYPRGGEIKMSFKKSEDIIKSDLIKSGSDVTLISYGRMIKEVYEAAKILALDGIDAGVICMKSIKPIDIEVIKTESLKTKKILFVDETVGFGSVGRVLHEYLNKNIEIRVKNFPDEFIEHGSVEELLEIKGLDAKGIVAAVFEWLRP